MKKVYISIICVSLVLCSMGQKKQMTLRDSLLQIYPEEKIKAMTPYEVHNAVQKMRGLPLIEVPKKRELPTHDRWGIPIVREVDEEKVIKSIRKRFQIIEQEKDGYKQVVFPNAYTDVLNGFFNGMYDDLVERILEYEDYLTYSFVDSWGGRDVNTFSNNTRRIYHFNEEDELRLITVEYGYNINKGPKNEYYDALQPFFYRISSYYIWEDTLQFVYSIEGIQRIIGKLPDEVPTNEELATSPIESKAIRRYFFKNNCFNQLKKEGSFPKKTWITDLNSLENEKVNSCDNRDVIMVRNYVLEYEERMVNNYLKPVESSYIQPYTIEPGN